MSKAESGNITLIHEVKWKKIKTWALAATSFLNRCFKIFEPGQTWSFFWKLLNHWPGSRLKLPLTQFKAQAFTDPVLIESFHWAGSKPWKLHFHVDTTLIDIVFNNIIASCNEIRSLSLAATLELVCHFILIEISFEFPLVCRKLQQAVNEKIFVHEDLYQSCWNPPSLMLSREQTKNAA